MNPNSGADRRSESRRAFSEFVRGYWRQLQRYAQRRLRYYQALGMLTPGDLTADDLVNEGAATALRRLPDKPARLGYYPWFRRVTDTVLRRYAQRAAVRNRNTVSLEEPVGETPDGETIRLRDILPDPNQLSPDDILVQREMQRRIETALNRLPDEWRECYLMANIDGLSPAEIATVEGRDTDEIRQDIRFARDFLRDTLSGDLQELNTDVRRRRGGLAA